MELLKEMFIKRTNVIKFIAITVVLSFSLGIIASSITVLPGFRPIYGIAVGILLSVVVFIYLIFIIFSNLTKTMHIKGFIVYNKQDNKLEYIERYHFSKEVINYLNSAMNEDQDLKAIWFREPLDCFNTVGDFIHGRISKSRQIINELVEYYVLEELSYHLSEYFNDSKFSKDNLKKFKRSEIEDVLFKNRFLNLFSKPMDERASFEVPKEKREKTQHEYLVDGKKVTLTEGETVFAYGKNNTMFRQFELVLPSNSKITKLNDSVKITTDRFVFEITTTFEENDYSVPEEFIDYCICSDENRDNSFFIYKPYEVNIILTIRFKILRFVFNGKWEYFSWLDSFLDRLDSRISERKYFKKINWDSALTLYKCLSKHNV